MNAQGPQKARSVGSTWNNIGLSSSRVSRWRRVVSS